MKAAKQNPDRDFISVSQTSNRGPLLINASKVSSFVSNLIDDFIWT